MSLFAFLRKSISIRDVVSAYVRLKPIGHYLKGSCPFHQEKDASFTISPEKQIFYCFGCHETGDVTAFIAKMESINQLEAARLLIDRHQLNVPEEFLTAEVRQPSSSERAAQQEYGHICQVLTDMMHQELMKNAVAYAYLEKRGLSTETIKRYRLGYLPAGSTRLAAFLKELHKEGVFFKDLITYGFLGENEHHTLYSPFEDRIIFPIYDHFGMPTGFGGRVFKPDDQRPKYYNSRESAWFMKGKLLFGFSHAKKSMQEKGAAFLVEGYVDCLAMVQHGYGHTVATLGTACTEEHLVLLARHITTLYVVYDADKAGTKATLRMAELCWRVNLDFKVVTLPKGEDPASLLSKQYSCDSYIEQAQDIFTFFINTVVDRFHAKPLAEKLAAAKRVIGLIATIQDPFKQELLLHQVSSAMRVQFQVVKNCLQGILDEEKKGVNGREVSPSQKGEIAVRAVNTKPKVVVAFDQLEKRIISAIINTPSENYQNEISQELLLFFSENARCIVQAIKEFLILQSKNSGVQGGDNVFFDAILDRFTDQQRDWVMRVCVESGDGPQSREVFHHLLSSMYKQQWTNLVRKMRHEVMLAEQEGNREKAQALLKEFADFKQGIEQKGFV